MMWKVKLVFKLIKNINYSRFHLKTGQLENKI
jgi:hypothetical protein